MHEKNHKSVSEHRERTIEIIIASLTRIYTAQYHANGHAKVIRLQLFDNLRKKNTQQIQRY